jgi:hypothetical protein
VSLIVGIVSVLSILLIGEQTRLAHQQAEIQMRLAQDAWRRGDSPTVVHALSRVMDYAQRDDGLRTSAIAGLVAQMPGTPQLIADLGPSTDAMISADNGIVLLRRPNNSWETWDVKRHLKLSGPNLVGVNSIRLSPDGRLAAAVLIALLLNCRCLIGRD